MNDLETMNRDSEILDAVFAVSSAVRYVALYCGGNLIARQRPGPQAASASESDRYEELFINPALLTLVRQRGNLDCGGAQYLVVRYGNFFQFCLALPAGHLSVCFEPGADPIAHAEAIREICNRTLPP